jgi:hypothetical protein
MRPGLPGLALIAAAASLGFSIAYAQSSPQAAPPARLPFALPPYKNLKVYPKDVSRADLIADMKLFARSLGVRCSYCHVGEEGKPLSTFDFASDAKDHKNIARDMIRLADRLNNTDLPDATGLPDAKVTCFTCHRGSTKPATAPPPDAAVPLPPATSKPDS